jgi:hypothetical protein
LRAGASASQWRQSQSGRLPRVSLDCVHALGSEQLGPDGQQSQGDPQMKKILLALALIAAAAAPAMAQNFANEYCQTCQ